MRLMKAEVSDLRAQVEKLTLERDDARERYREVSQGMEQHAVAIETLENRNDVLELRSSALEDQMALLFGQLSDDFLFYNESLLTRTTDTLEIQKELSAPRSVFSQNIDGVQKRLLHFQSLLNDIQQDSKIMNGADGGTIKAKVKQLEHHVQQLYGRFSSVKEGLMSTSEELLAALADKKKILNFCCEHIRLYDLQNQKLRNGRAELHELRQRISVVERCVAETLASGQALSIDRNGDITHTTGNNNNNNNNNAVTSPTSTTYGGGVSFKETSLRRHQLASIKELQEQLLAVQDSANTLTLSLDGTNEQKQLLRAISLSTPSTRKSAAGAGGGGGGGGSRSSSKGISIPHVGGGEVGVGVKGGHHHALKSAGQLLVALQSQLGRVKRLDGGGGASGGSSRRDSRMVMGHPSSMSPLGDSSNTTAAATNHFNTSRAHTAISRRESATTSTMASRLGSAGGVVRSASSGKGAADGGGAAASPLEINNLKREFLRKLVFMKNVYESRISELEERVDGLLKQVSGKQQPQQQPLGLAGTNASLMSTTTTSMGGGGGGRGAAGGTSPHQQQYQPLWSFTPDPNAVPPKAKSPPLGGAASADGADAAMVVAPSLHPTFNTAGYMPPVDTTPTAPTSDPTGGTVDVAAVDSQVKALEGLGGVVAVGKSPAPMDPDQLAASQAQWASTRQELHEYVGSLRGGIPMGEDDDEDPFGASSKPKQAPVTVLKVRPIHRSTTTSSSSPAGGTRGGRRGMGGGASPHPPRSTSLGRSMGSSGMGSPAGRGGVHYAPEEGGGGAANKNDNNAGDEATISIYSVADSRTYALSVLNTLVRGTGDPAGDSQAASFSMSQRR